MSDTNTQATPANDTKDKTPIDKNCCTVPPGGGDPGPGI
jgi:hypothetical protein